MGVLFPDKKNVSKKEFKNVRSRLSHEGFDKRELNEVEMVLGPDLEKTFRGQKINEQDLKRHIDWLEHNKSKHHLSDEEIKKLKDELKKKL